MPSLVLQLLRVGSVVEPGDDVGQVPPVGPRLGGDHLHARVDERRHLLGVVVQQELGVAADEALEGGDGVAAVGRVLLGLLVLVQDWTLQMLYHMR